MIDDTDYRASPSAALEEIDALAGALAELALFIDQYPGLIPDPLRGLAVRVSARPAVARRLHQEVAA